MHQIKVVDFFFLSPSSAVHRYTLSPPFLADLFSGPTLREPVADPYSISNFTFHSFFLYQHCWVRGILSLYLFSVNFSLCLHSGVCCHRRSNGSRNCFSLSLFFRFFFFFFCMRSISINSPFCVKSTVNTRLVDRSNLFMKMCSWLQSPNVWTNVGVECTVFHTVCTVKTSDFS